MYSDTTYIEVGAEVIETIARPGGVGPGGLVPGGRSAFFLAVLAVHIAAGLFSVAFGAAAALSPKGRGAHASRGRLYYRGLAVVFATAAILAAMQWPKDNYLVVLGAIAFISATVGKLARRPRLRSDAAHIVGMGLSYISMLTAFYVDNGPRLPVWDRLPTPALWVLPSAIGAPLVVRAVVQRLPERTFRQP